MNARAWAELSRRKLAEGRLSEAWRWLIEAEAHGPPPGLAALKAELLSRLGRPEEAARALGRALPPRPAQARARLRAAARLSGPGARAALDRAVALWPSPETYLARSAFLERFGGPMEATADCAEALRLAPSAELFLRRARLLLGHRQLSLALRDLRRARRLAPRDGGAARALAEGLLACGRPLPAAAAFARAGEPHRQAACLAFAGRWREALALLRDLPRGSRRAWAEGFASCVGRRWARGAALFDAAGAPLLAEAARARAELVAARGPRGEVLLCGLGIDPPQSASLEVLAALASCDVVFRNVSGEGVSEFLRLLGPSVRPVVFRYEQDVPAVVSRLLALARRGRRVGFATFGHPLICGPLALELLRRAARAGVPCRALGGPSSVDAMLASAARRRLGSFRGFEVLAATGPEAARRLERTDVSLPLLLYLPDPGLDAWREGFFDALRRRYRGSRALLFSGDHGDWAGGKELSVSALARRPSDELFLGMAAVLPAVK